MVKGKVFRASCCFIVEAHFCGSEKICVCSVNFRTKMVHLWLGIGAKVTILVSRLHPKNLISRAYANYTKIKVEGLVVVSKGSKSICHVSGLHSHSWFTFAIHDMIGCGMTCGDIMTNSFVFSCE